MEVVQAPGLWIASLEDGAWQLIATAPITGLSVFDAAGREVLHREGTHGHSAIIERGSLDTGLHVVRAALIDGRTVTLRFIAVQ